MDVQYNGQENNAGMDPAVGAHPAHTPSKIGKHTINSVKARFVFSAHPPNLKYCYDIQHTTRQIKDR